MSKGWEWKSSGLYCRHWLSHLEPEWQRQLKQGSILLSDSRHGNYLRNKTRSL